MDENSPRCGNECGTDEEGSFGNGPLPIGENKYIVVGQMHWFCLKEGAGTYVFVFVIAFFLGNPTVTWYQV